MRTVLIEDERGNLEIAPYQPDERVDADTFYTFFESEQEAAVSLLRQLEENPQLWCHPDTLAHAKSVAS